MFTSLLLSLLFPQNHLSAEDTEKPVLSQEQVIKLATKYLIKNGYNKTKINFDDARFDVDEKKWVVLFWEEKGQHDIVGVMVKVSNSKEPQFEIIREQ